MTRKTSTSAFCSALLLGALSVLPACGTPARRIETGGPQSITSIRDVDDQDIKEAATKMLESLLSTGVLNQSESKPAVLLIGRIKNDTSSEFPIENLTYAMREQLVNSGQAAVNTTFGTTPEAGKTRDQMLEEQFETGKPVRIANDFELTGSITEVFRAAGDVRQATFTFRLTLTAIRGPRKGLEVWTKQESFTKQGTKASVGR